MRPGIRLYFIACCAVLLALPLQAAQLSLTGKGELIYNVSASTPPWLTPWYSEGTGQLALNDNGFLVGPQYFGLHLDTDSSISAQLFAQWHKASQTGVSVTEAWLNWAPLPEHGYRWRGRLGYFYPQLSLENTDTAWTSPYSSSFSAINSWFAEELRTRGIELSVSRPGHFFRSRHSWTAVLGIFQGNDAIGTLLSWRGFALHNLQTGLGERVYFANYPSIEQPPLQLQNNWVEPTRELDHRTGYYTGLHWQVQQSSQIRVYYYDNGGDPLVFNHQQYAWRTRFISVAAEHQVNRQLRLVSQWLSGNTLMGPAAVDADYVAWFLLGHWQQDDYGVTVRYDRFKVTDKDDIPSDNNNGSGSAITLSLSWQLAERLQLRVEHVHLRSVQQNRQQWYWPAAEQQRNTQLIAIWRW